MDALVALGDDGAHAQQPGALGGPVAGAAAAVLRAREDHQRHALRLVAHRRRRTGTSRSPSGWCVVYGPSLVGERVAQPDVAEGAAHHHLVMSAAGAIAVEVERRHAVRLEPLAGRAPAGDRARGRDVVGGHRVAQHRQHPRAHDVGDGRRLGRQPLEERRQRDVARCRVPGVAVALRDGQAPPALVALEHAGIGRAEELGRDGLADGGTDLLAAAARCRTGRPARPSRSRPSGSVVRSMSTRPASAIRDHQRRRREVAGPDLGMDAALEVAVARQHRRDHQVVVLDRLRDRCVERPAVADAGRAAVADEVEARAARAGP